jgi:subtilase family serine protease
MSCKLIYTALFFSLGSLICQQAFADSSEPRLYTIHSFRMHAENVKPPQASGNDDGIFSAPYTPAYPTFQPSQLQKAYGLNQLSETGAGQTIAIVDAYGSPSIQSDLNAYSTAFGLPQTQIDIVYPYGEPSTTNSSWALETDIDVEFAHSIAPQAKIVLVVTQNNGSQLDTAIQWISGNAASLGITVVSMSWYGNEWSNETYYDSYMDIPGVTWVACSGDSGAGAYFPASSPNVLGVGATQLKVSSSGAYSSESAWADTGGGLSAYELKPAYQDAFQTSSYRSVPDVSYAGAQQSPEWCYVDGSWDYCWGTSIAAPQWAGLVALANSQRKTNLSGLNSILYGLASSGKLTTYFHDVTSGCDGSASGDCATTGYDKVSGLGSPIANMIVPALVAH